jgi:hypothetical protein
MWSGEFIFFIAIAWSTFCFIRVQRFTFTAAQSLACTGNSVGRSQVELPSCQKAVNRTVNDRTYAVQMLANEDGALRTDYGYVFPPCICVEKGESLNEFARNVDHELITVIHALSLVAKRLAQMHAAGWVHRDLKPGNILRMPQQHSWALIDFGASARVGTYLREPSIYTSLTLKYNHDVVLSFCDVLVLTVVWEGSRRFHGTLPRYEFWLFSGWA